MAAQGKFQPGKPQGNVDGQTDLEGERDKGEFLKSLQIQGCCLVLPGEDGSAGIPHSCWWNVALEYLRVGWGRFGGQKNPGEAAGGCVVGGEVLDGISSPWQSAAGNSDICRAVSAPKNLGEIVVVICGGWRESLGWISIPCEFS